MRAWICRPGTVLVIGVRAGAFGEMTLRSVLGVKAPVGKPGSELSAGVVCALVVVRSALATHVASTRSFDNAFSTSAHVRPACAAELTNNDSGMQNESAATPQMRESM